MSKPTRKRPAQKAQPKIKRFICNACQVWLAPAEYQAHDQSPRHRKALRGFALDVFVRQSMGPIHAPGEHCWLQITTLGDPRRAMYAR